MFKKFQILLFSVFSLLLMSPFSFAVEDPEVAAMYASVDMSDLKTKTAALIASTILIPLIFTAGVLIRRSIRAAKG